jgi:hypothetical protein
VDVGVQREARRVVPEPALHLDRVAALREEPGGDGEFIARQAWLYVSIVAGAYLISRGLAKSGSADPYSGDRSDNGRS